MTLQPTFFSSVSAVRRMVLLSSITMTFRLSKFSSINTALVYTAVSYRAASGRQTDQFHFRLLLTQFQKAIHKPLPRMSSLRNRSSFIRLRCRGYTAVTSEQPGETQHDHSRWYRHGSDQRDPLQEGQLPGHAAGSTAAPVAAQLHGAAGPVSAER